MIAEATTHHASRTEIDADELLNLRPVTFSNGLCCEMKIVQRTKHPSVVVVMVELTTKHATCFPSGIEDFAIGCGETESDAVHRAGDHEPEKRSQLKIIDAHSGTIVRLVGSMAGSE